MRLTESERKAIEALENRLASSASVWRGRSGVYVEASCSKSVAGCGRSVADAIDDLISKLGLKP